VPVGDPGLIFRFKERPQLAAIRSRAARSRALNPTILAILPLICVAALTHTQDFSSEVISCHTDAINYKPTLQMATPVVVVGRINV
jgi:hypothetical protein